jgi:hypothetical protein
MTDKTKLISTVISGAALIISIASYRDSREARRQADNARRPVLQISSLRLTAKPAFGQKLRLELDLHTFGQSIGKDVEFTYEYFVDTRGSRTVKRDSISGALFGVGNVAPGSSRLIALTQGNALYKPDRASSEGTLLVYGWLRYRLEEGQALLEEPYCFVTELAQAAVSPTTTLYSCDSAFDSDLRNIPGGAEPAPSPRAVPGGRLGR